MKNGKALLAGITALLAIVLLQSEATAKRGGTSILHFMLRADMDSAGFNLGASGIVKAKRNKQGNADNQQLEIFVTNLDGDASYDLLASTLDDTNFHEVAAINTDSSGGADVKYVKKNGNASPGGSPLPSGLDPISSIRALAISIGGTQEVLRADLASAAKLQYLIKRPMDNDNHSVSSAALRIKATQSDTQLRIRAEGLTANSTYHLDINGDVAESLTSDTEGKLDVDGLPVGSPDIREITSMAILDGGSNSVLSTTLP